VLAGPICSAKSKRTSTERAESIVRLNASRGCRRERIRVIHPPPETENIGAITRLARKRLKRLARGVEAKARVIQLSMRIRALELWL